MHIYRQRAYGKRGHMANLCPSTPSCLELKTVLKIEYIKKNGILHHTTTEVINVEPLSLRHLPTEALRTPGSWELAEETMVAGAALLNKDPPPPTTHTAPSISTSLGSRAVPEALILSTSQAWGWLSAPQVKPLLQGQLT